MKTACRYPECGNRRVHHERPDTMRGQQMVDVLDRTPEAEAVFCSLTCAIMDGWLSVKYSTKEQTKAREDKWYAMHQLRLQARKDSE